MSEISRQFVGFEVLMSVTMKRTIFWDVTPCSLVEFTDVSEEHTAYIFTVKEYAKQTEGRWRQCCGNFSLARKVLMSIGNFLVLKATLYLRIIFFTVEIIQLYIYRKIILCFKDYRKLYLFHTELEIH
jgi:hypothetical protein